MDITKARRNVIEQQVRPWGGLNLRANQALSDVPRENFVPEGFQGLVFADIEIPLSDNAKMFSPKIEGRILDSINIQGDESVLEIGTGSGYFTAVLGKLADSVVSIEIDQALSASAKKNIDALAINNVDLQVSDASTADFSKQKFDVIVLGCSLNAQSQKLNELLNTGGRLFAIIGSKNKMQATLTTRLGDNEWQAKSIFETHLDYMQGQEPTAVFAF
ncbi:MAG TPA: protein-L-isoaspartate O-methyltransferase [Candidatus Thioglobus sp.]|jgi:protein-L-isoaspartate(D-aspartate) O-methyltransferase|nr:protein-L-isoaspartate O-methyltransferase [Candidatus Thioglobus sp.]HIL21114.1 protein-L-isoaspartate O-methyltransferase [Candidatus Thioglobus sp.]